MSKASGVPYDRYVHKQILQPLGMMIPRWSLRKSRPTAERLDTAVGRLLLTRAAAATRRVRRHGWNADYGADLGRYVAFHLSAGPRATMPIPGR